MGTCNSCLSKRTAEESASAQQSQTIDRQIRAEGRRMKTEVRLLLLGAGESGKSTVLKQMKLIHTAGFDAAERENYRVIVFNNVYNIMETLLEILDHEGITLEDTSLEQYFPLFVDLPPIRSNMPYPEQFLEPLKRLWADPGIQEARKFGDAFALQDNGSYFYNDLDRLWSQYYCPSDQDIINCRSKTTGITEAVFYIKSLTYRLVDVGGQRSERKKWMHCFQDVTAVLFVVAISGYDRCLMEDRDANQMHEALMLFDNICNSPWFEKTSMILFMNKIDVFRKKIATTPISKYFPDYNGKEYDFEAGCKYFKMRFERLNRNPNKCTYTYFTNATDRNLLENVMVAVSDIILNENLSTFVL